MTTQLEQAWELAKQRFAAVGIDVEEALRQLDRLPVSKAFATDVALP